MTTIVYQPTAAAVFVDAPSRLDLNEISNTSASFVMKDKVLAQELSALVAPTQAVRALVTNTFQSRVALAGGVLRQSVHVTLEGAEGGGVLAVENRTGMYGFGGSLVEAVNDLRTSLVEYRETLQASAPLSATLEEHLEYLNLVLVQQ